MVKRTRFEKFFEPEETMTGPTSAPAMMWGLAVGAVLGAVGGIAVAVQCGLGCGSVPGLIFGIAFSVGIGAFAGYCLMFFFGAALMVLAGVVDWLHRVLFKD